MIFFILEAIITTNSILTDQVSQDSIEKPEEPARSRHCNSERICRKRHWGNPGRRRGTMNWSQENCLIDDHRLTCERWGGDLRLAIGSRLLDAVPAMVSCAHAARHAARQGYFIASLSFAGKEAAFILRTRGHKACCSSQTSSRMPCASIASTDAAEKCFQQMGTAAENSYLQMG